MREIVMSLFCGLICYALVEQIGENIAIGLPKKKTNNKSKRRQDNIGDYRRHSYRAKTHGSRKR